MIYYESETERGKDGSSHQIGGDNSNPLELSLTLFQLVV